MPTSFFWGCLPTVFRPRGAVFTCGADIYLRCYRLHGGCGFEFTSGGSCGRACNVPPKNLGHLPAVLHRHLPAVLRVVYLRSSVLAGRCLPAVLTSTCGAFGMFTSGGAKIFMPDGMGCIPPVVSPTLSGSTFEYTSGGSCGRACNVQPIDWNIYLRWGY